MRIVLVGAPGSGKGTQAKKIAAKYKVPQISTGGLLRTAVAAKTTSWVTSYGGNGIGGQLVSDQIIIGMIEERLEEPDTQDGFVLNGFPRNLPQSAALDTLLNRLGCPLESAILIEVDFDSLIQRIVGRRNCSSCGQMYNVFTSPPKIDDHCNLCGNLLHHRADDSEANIINRLRVYEIQIEAMLRHYRIQGKYAEIDGGGEVNRIFARMCATIDQLQAQKSKLEVPIRQKMEKVSSQKVKSFEKTTKLDGKAKEVLELTETKSEVSLNQLNGSATKEAKTMAVKKKATRKSAAKKKVARKKVATKKKGVKKSVKKKAVKKKAAKKKVAKRKTAKKKVAKKKVAKKKVSKRKTAKKKVSKRKTAKKKVSKRKTAKKKVAKKKGAKKKTAKKKGAKKKAVKKKTAKKKAVKKKARAKKTPLSG